MTTTDQIHAEALKVAETLPIFGLFKISPAIPNDPRRIVMPADIERILEVGRLIGLEQAEKLAQSHIGKAQRQRISKGAGSYSPDSFQSIRAEERGEDIAAAEIRDAIKSLRTP